MLQSEELDQDGFEEILQRAIGKIPQIYPDWTDYNPSDPGITILELMSYYTEISEYHLNVIDDDSYRKYLKLLGRIPPERTPARTWLKVTGGGRLPVNTRFYAEDIPFETEYEVDISDNEIISIQSGDIVIENKNNLFSDLHSKFSFSPFEGKDGQDNNGFEIHLNKPLRLGEIAGVYVQISEWENTAPFAEDFQPYVKYHCERYDGGWQRGVEIMEDETQGFCKSGIILLKITGQLSQGKGTKIRFLIDSGEYPVQPVITGMLWNVVPARQKATHTQVIDAGMTYGICDWHIKTDIKGCIPRSIQLSVLEKSGKYAWECVEDFDNSKPLSRQFRYDENRGEIIFGDGIHGRTPKGRVFIERYETTEGADGNIKESVLTCDDNWSAVNILPAVGGRNQQSTEDCFQELRNGEHAPKRCVTTQDYENAVKNTPGVPVHRVKAFPSRKKENTICIAVEGVEKKRILNKSCIDNLKQYILPKTLIGTSVEFLQPQYTRIYVFLEISVHPYYENCEEKTIDAVKAYFDSSEISFGDTIRGSQVINRLYGLPWIKGIGNLELSCSGNRRKNGNGRDIILDNDCLPYVDNVTVRITD
jgi:hypothetical protein